MLDTRFTGTSSGKLSGLGGVATDFPGADQDSGVAKLLANFELTGRIPQVRGGWDINPHRVSHEYLYNNQLADVGVMFTKQPRQ